MTKEQIAAKKLAAKVAKELRDAKELKEKAIIALLTSNELTRKQVTSTMKDVNEKKKRISEELKKERSFFGCLRYISKNQNESFIAEFFESIGSTFHKDCIVDNEPVKSVIDLFNSAKSESLINRETDKPKVSYSVNYIVSVLTANFKATLNAKVTSKSKETKEEKIARLTLELSELNKVA